jgi:hypothetical protein
MCCAVLGKSVSVSACSLARSVVRTLLRCAMPPPTAAAYVARLCLSWFSCMFVWLGTTALDEGNLVRPACLERTSGPCISACFQLYFSRDSIYYECSKYMLENQKKSNTTLPCLRPYSTLTPKSCNAHAWTLACSMLATFLYLSVFEMKPLLRTAQVQSCRVHRIHRSILA